MNKDFLKYEDLKAGMYLYDTTRHEKNHHIAVAWYVGKNSCIISYLGEGIQWECLASVFENKFIDIGLPNDGEDKCFKNTYKYLDQDYKSRSIFEKMIDRLLNKLQKIKRNMVHKRTGFW